MVLMHACHEPSVELFDQKRADSLAVDEVLLQSTPQSSESLTPRNGRDQFESSGTIERRSESKQNEH